VRGARDFHGRTLVPMGGPLRSATMWPRQIRSVRFSGECPSGARAADTFGAADRERLGPCWRDFSSEVQPRGPREGARLPDKPACSHASRPESACDPSRSSPRTGTRTDVEIDLMPGVDVASCWLHAGRLYGQRSGVRCWRGTAQLPGRPSCQVARCRQRSSLSDREVARSLRTFPPGGFQPAVAEGF